MGSRFQDISAKVHANERLTLEDGIYLYEEAPLLELGALADFANRRKNGLDVYYNVNRHINPTNVCVKDCKFCAFSRKPGDEGAYEYSIDDIISKAREVVDQGATEVHMVGGLHPRWKFSYYLEILSAIKTNFPSLHIKAFTAVEIDWLAAKARLSIEETLRQLKEAGLGSMPGGGAEIFHPEIRLKICDTKTTGERWIDIHRTAHRMGLRSNCTMLYGHIESPHHRVDHMIRLRELQDETRGFNVFIPLAFQPQDNYMGITRYTPGADDLRTIAVARLMLDNFQHIKAYWIMLGQDIAQLALSFGANDLDGTVTEEKISRMAGGRAGMAMSKQFIQNLIERAHRIPVERDTLYHPVSRQEAMVRPQPQMMLLYKAEKAELLSVDDYVAIAESVELTDLSRASGGTLSLAAARHNEIDLNESTDLSHDTLRLMVEQNKTEVIRGFKKLWALAKGNDLARMLRDLRAAGVRKIGSSRHETLLDLTPSELTELHSLCHEAGLRTGSKIEINATAEMRPTIFWSQFVQKALLTRRIFESSEGIESLTLDIAKDTIVTPAEFMRALSLLKLMMKGLPIQVEVEYEALPTIKARQGAFTSVTSDPGFKLAGIAPLFGADRLWADQGSLATIEAEIRSAKEYRA